jgi:hypothetical protein
VLSLPTNRTPSTASATIGAPWRQISPRKNRGPSADGGWKPPQLVTSPTSPRKNRGPAADCDLPRGGASQRSPRLVTPPPATTLRVRLHNPRLLARECPRHIARECRALRFAPAAGDLPAKTPVRAPVRTGDLRPGTSQRDLRAADGGPERTPVRAGDFAGDLPAKPRDLRST